VFPTLLSCLLLTALAAEWYVFYWRVLPPAVSIIHSVGTGYSWPVGITLGVVRVIGRFSLIVLPLTLILIVVTGLVWRPARALGGHAVLLLLLGLQAYSVLIFIMVFLDAIKALTLSLPS
jgi:hypothetical protein